MDSEAVLTTDICYSIRVTQLPFRPLIAAALGIYRMKYLLELFKWSARLQLQNIALFRIAILSSHLYSSIKKSNPKTMDWRQILHLSPIIVTNVIESSISYSIVHISCCPAISLPFSSNYYCQSKLIAENWYDIAYWKLKYLRHIDRSP